MRKIIFSDFYLEHKSHYILPFILISSAFHLILLSLIMSGVFSNYNPSTGHSNMPGHENQFKSHQAISRTEYQTPSSRRVQTAYPNKRRSRSEYRQVPGIPHNQGIIRGKIMHKTGEPVKGANVAVINLQTRKPTATLTDENGIFDVSKLSPGAHEIRIRTIRFDQVVRKVVQIHGGQILNYSYKPIETVNPSTIGISQIKPNEVIDLRSINKAVDMPKKIIPATSTPNPDFTPGRRIMNQKSFMEIIHNNQFNRFRLFKDGEDWILKLTRNSDSPTMMSYSVKTGRKQQRLIFTDYTIVVMNTLYYALQTLKKLYYFLDSLCHPIAHNIDICMVLPV